MSEQEATRRLVKSGPELWAQCSDPTLLSRHLAGFGEITVTSLEPESTVAWEGESARGTVSLESSGWGTRVRLTAIPAPPEPEPVIHLDPPTPAPDLASGIRARIAALLNRRRTRVVVAPGPPAQQPAPVPVPPDVMAELEAALDSLGAAHHRPYSRS